MATVSAVASIVIGQLGGAGSILVIRGAGMVSGHDGQTFLEKIRRRNETLHRVLCN